MHRYCANVCRCHIDEPDQNRTGNSLPFSNNETQPGPFQRPVTPRATCSPPVRMIIGHHSALHEEAPALDWRNNPCQHFRDAAAHLRRIAGPSFALPPSRKRQPSTSFSQPSSSLLAPFWSPSPALPHSFPCIYRFWQKSRTRMTENGKTEFMMLACQRAGHGPMTRCDVAS